jgi:protocatechuate 3,4-dioxygenase beta subunit
MPGGRPFKTGTGRIAGRVLAAESGSPIRRAQVRINSPDIGMKTSLTDAQGRYEFHDLPAGRFNLHASKSGYVNVQYGQTRPFESGRPIELADRQVMEKADFNMPRGSIIAGRIVDEFGEPVADVMVSAMRQTWAGGRRRLVPGGRPAQTNDLGQFRLYGLPPGDYYVSASLRNMESFMFDVAGPGGPSGSSPASGYAPTYFPGTASPSDAQKVSVAVGQEAQQTDFALVPTRLSRITGVAMGADGKPLEGAMVNAVPQNRGGDLGAMMMSASGRTTKDGNFTLNGVAPGEYLLNVRSMRVTSGDGPAGGVMFTAAMTEDAEFASLPLTVAGEDLSNVVVIASKGASAAGRVSFEGGTKPDNLTSIRVSAQAADPMDGPMMMGPMPMGGGQVKADGTFELKGLSGTRLFRAFNLPNGWMLKAVRVGGDEVTDTGVEFKPGQHLANVEVVVTSRVTEVNGSVTAAEGAALKDYTVVIFSDDPQHWALPMSRWVTGARPDQEGRFQVRNLPPGSYYAAAVDYVEMGAWSDPDLLERLKTSASRFTLGDGESQTLNLKLTLTQ